MVPHFRLDRSYGMTRTEVRSKHGDSPSAICFLMDFGTGRFALLHELRVPQLHSCDQRESEGYGEYLRLFTQEA